MNDIKECKITSCIILIVNKEEKKAVSVILPYSSDIDEQYTIFKNFINNFLNNDFISYEDYKKTRNSSFYEICLIDEEGNPSVIQFPFEKYFVDFLDNSFEDRFKKEYSLENNNIGGNK